MKQVVILGPTASGKSSLAIKLARQFNGEIVSADSRQVYKGMDIGSGKITKKEQKLVPHHLLDVASPNTQYTVSEFQRDGKTAIEQINSKGKLPFIVGGTAFYIYVLIDNLEIPEVKPNLKLRKSLETKTLNQLFTMLKKLDPKRAKLIDKHNRVRLVRAIEIVKATGKPIPQISVRPTSQSKNTLILGIVKPADELRRLINKRVDERLKLGMVNEVKKLRKGGVSFQRLEAFGLEYRFVAWYLQKKLSYDQMVEQLKTAIWQFSRHQMTWFKRDKRIKWITSEKQAQSLIKSFIKK